MEGEESSLSSDCLNALLGRCKFLALFADSAGDNHPPKAGALGLFRCLMIYFCALSWIIIRLFQSAGGAAISAPKRGRGAFFGV